MTATAPLRVFGCLVLLGSLLLVGSPSARAAAATSSTAGTYVAVPSTPLFDTRSGLGTTRAPIPAGGAINVHVPVPAGATVALHLVLASATKSGWLASYPMGGSSSVSVLNYVSGQQRNNLTLVQAGPGGNITIANHSAGTAQVAGDYAGYYVSGTATVAGALQSGGPNPLFDTRSGLGTAKAPIPAGGTIRVKVPVPAGSTVALHLVLASSTKSGWLASYPSGGSSSVSALNYVAGQIQSDLTLVQTGPDGYVQITNHSAGTAQVAGDFAAYYRSGSATDGGALVPIPATPVADQRSGLGLPKGSLGPGATQSFVVAGYRSLPAGSTVALHLVAVSATRAGWLAAYPSGGSSSVSAINFDPSRTSAGLAFTTVGSDGKITVTNHSGGSLVLAADIAAYHRPGALATPAVSTSRYVRNITGVSTDASRLHEEGCTDAQAGSTLVLLDIGAQTVTAPLSTSNPGVLLSTTSTRIAYPALVSALTGYLSGFHDCAPSAAATLVVSTNSDGAFTGTNAYPAQTRGTDWAAQVVAPLRSAAATGLTVLGGNDIESSEFTGTEDQAEAWESSYLANQTVGTLVYNGSADGCPTGFGVTGATCSNGWTQADYYRLAGGSNSARVAVLPQIYVPEQAAQWANIDHAGGGSLRFLGALTEYASCPSAGTNGCTIAALTPSQGWSSLFYALNNFGRSAPATVTDLRIDS